MPNSDGILSVVEVIAQLDSQPRDDEYICFYVIDQADDPQQPWRLFERPTSTKIPVIHMVKPGEADSYLTLRQLRDYLATYRDDHGDDGQVVRCLYTTKGGGPTGSCITKIGDSEYDRWLAGAGGWSVDVSLYGFDDKPPSRFMLDDFIDHCQHMRAKLGNLPVLLDADGDHIWQMGALMYDNMDPDDQKEYGLPPEYFTPRPAEQMRPKA